MTVPKSILKEAYVSETYATGKDLLPCLRKLEAAVSDEDRATAVSALFIMAVVLQAPHLSDEELQTVVWELSKRTCLLLAGTDKPTQEVKH